MDSRIDPSEREAIKDLLRDFAENDEVTVEQVFKESWLRFNAIENSEDILDLIGQAILDLNDDSKHQIALIICDRLFRDLFSFAGKFRSIDDPQRGVIYFGKQKSTAYQPTFMGVKPTDIPNEIESAFGILTNHGNPLMNGLKFYQKFVKVHPFYDGNGRIARLLTNAYLFHFKQSISWNSFDSKSKFIKKLNYCHTAESQ